jgi:hypothetical protein
MGERSIFAYFQTMERAQEAAQKLKQRGFETVQVDRFSPIPGGGKEPDQDHGLNSILRQQDSSLTTTTMGLPPISRDRRILAAANPDASGLSDGSPFDHAEDVCLTVITDNSRFEEAIDLLEQLGAYI